MSDNTAKDINKIVRYLSSNFRNLAANFDSKFSESQVKQLESDFAWQIHEITMSPSCIVQKYIIECNEFLDNLAKRCK